MTVVVKKPTVKHVSARSAVASKTSTLTDAGTSTPTCATPTTAGARGYGSHGNASPSTSRGSFNPMTPMGPHPMPFSPTVPFAPSPGLVATSGSDGGHARNNTGADNFSGVSESFSLDAPSSIYAPVGFDAVAAPVSQSSGVTERPD